jgi:large repetitive protein
MEKKTSNGVILSGAKNLALALFFIIPICRAAYCQQLTVTIPSPLTITNSAAIPKFTALSPFSFTFTASGCVPPYTWLLASGSLPAGLSLTSSGILSGTPNAGGQFSFSVAAACGSGVTLSLTEPFLLTGSHVVALSWSAAPGAAGYNVYRGTAAGKESATALNSAALTSPAFVDSTVSPGTTYYYVAKAVSSIGTLSANSNEASAVVPNP